VIWLLQRALAALAAVPLTAQYAQGTAPFWLVLILARGQGIEARLLLVVECRLVTVSALVATGQVAQNSVRQGFLVCAFRTGRVLGDGGMAGSRRTDCEGFGPSQTDGHLKEQRRSPPDSWVKESAALIPTARSPVGRE
jgi:hypothetical protein